MAELTERVNLDVPAETAWAALTDWRRQGEWMLGTTVRLLDGDGRSVGSTLAATTEFGPVGFTDTMEITSFEEPRRCEVKHTGELVRGDGVFEVLPSGPRHCTFVWSERLDLPFGLLGKVGWLGARWPFTAGVRLSLRRFAKFARQYDR